MPKISEICTRICSGGTPKSTNLAFYGGNIPWLNTKEIDFNFINSTEKYITEDGLNNSSAKWIEPPCVIVAMYGATAGKVAISNIRLTTNQACCNLNIDPSKADYKFVYYSLKKDYYLLSSLANGGAQQNLNAQQIKDFGIPDFSLAEQKKIAGILSALDDKIETNLRISARLEELTQAIFKSWFIDFEPFGGKKPDDWKNCSLAQLTRECKEKVKDRDNVKVLSPISSGELVLSDDYFTKQVYSKELSKYIIVKPHEFAYNPARINIGSIGINDYNFDGCVSPVYVVFKAIEGYEDFLKYFIKTRLFKEEVSLRAIGGVRQTLNYKDFSLIEFHKPSIDFVKKFSRIVSSLYDNIKVVNNESARLASLRDALLPKLMAGEIKPE